MQFSKNFNCGKLLQCFEEECGLWRSAYITEFIGTHKVSLFVILNIPNQGSAKILVREYTAIFGKNMNRMYKNFVYWHDQIKFLLNGVL